MKARELEWMILRHKNETHLDYKPWVWPREPEVYGKTAHYRRKMKTRVMEQDRVDNSISHGQIFPASGTKIIFRSRDYGVSYYVVVGYDVDEDNNFIVTAYPFLYDVREARRDGSPHTTREVNDIRETTRAYLLQDRIKEMIEVDYGATYDKSSLLFTS